MRIPGSIAVTLVTLSLAAAACSGAAGTDGAAPRGDEAPASGATADSRATPQTEQATQSGSPDAFPGSEWEMATAEESGMDQGVLDEIAAKAEAGSSYCLVVTTRWKAGRRAVLAGHRTVDAS